MFGAIPKTSWSKRYPSDEANGCRMAMRSMLIKTGCGRVILVDTGAGNKHLRLLGYYRFSGLTDLGDELQKRGVSKDEVTDVVLTHLHFDHCGYITLRDEETGRLELAFPNATHWVSRAQWESFLNPHPLEKASFMQENMALAADVLQLISGNTQICPGVSLELYNGHTSGQIAPYVEAGGRTYVFAGDVIPLAASVSPAWISAYDMNQRQSYDEKIRLLERAAKEKQVLFFCHDAYTLCATVKKVGSFFKADQIMDQRKYEDHAG